MSYKTKHIITNILLIIVSLLIIYMESFMFLMNQYTYLLYVTSRLIDIILDAGNTTTIIDLQRYKDDLYVDLIDKGKFRKLYKTIQKLMEEIRSQLSFTKARSFSTTMKPELYYFHHLLFKDIYMYIAVKIILPMIPLFIYNNTVILFENDVLRHLWMAFTILCLLKVYISLKEYFYHATNIY